MVEKDHQQLDEAAVDEPVDELQMAVEEEEKQPEDQSDGVGEKLGDRTLALTLNQAIVANCKIEGLNQKLVQSLEYSQESYRQETKRIAEL